MKISKDSPSLFKPSSYLIFHVYFLLSGDSMYDGEWKDDKMEGKGKLVYRLIDHIILFSTISSLTISSSFNQRRNNL